MDRKKLSKNKCIIVLWFLTIFCLPQPCMSSNLKVISSLAPEFKDGANADILEAIARKLDARLEIKPAPFKRRLRMMETGQIDLMVGLLKNPGRERYIHYIQPPYKNRSDTVFFVQRGKAELVRRYEDLYHLRIGIMVGSRYFPAFDNDSRLNTDVCIYAKSNLKKLVAGRIDAAVFPESAGIDLIDSMGIKEHVAIADFRYSRQKHVHIGFSKKSHLMNSMQQVEDSLRSMIESGEIRQVIVEHYTRRGLPVPAF